MTGPEHYREAERVLDGLNDEPITGGKLTPQEVASLLAFAQVHATLAQSAATIEPLLSEKSDASPILEAWSRVIS